MVMCARARKKLFMMSMMTNLVLSREAHYVTWKERDKKKKRKKTKRFKPRNRKFSENCGLRCRADKERARLIEKICKAGGTRRRGTA